MAMFQVYDTTLRDGLQGEGVVFSVDDKIRVVQALDDLGIDYIEGGWPGATPKDQEFFQRMKGISLKNSRLVAFGSTRRANNRPEDDPILRNLLEAETPTVTIFGKTWDFHVREVLRITLEENLALIEDSVAFLKAHGREVFYDAEHFYDGYRANPEYALATIGAAIRGGADMVILCDTNGGTLPKEALHIFQEISKKVTVPLGVHFHNDTGMAAANSVLSVQEGARQVQGTFNGYGERCGNANLSTILPTLVLKLKMDCKAATNLTKLTSVSRLLSELANLHHDERQPTSVPALLPTGRYHVDAVQKLPHFGAHRTGFRRQCPPLPLVGSGRTQYHPEPARQLVPNVSKDAKEIKALTNQLKELEHLGFQFEAAEASFDLLIKKAFNLYEKVFNLEGFRVIVEKRGDNPSYSEASIKVSVNGVTEITAAEGNGPVNALDSAIRKALARFYPKIQNVFLTDFKVRVLEENSGTGAKVRVLIQTSNGRQSWGTVGVSENIIEASWQALVDGIEYGILEEKKDKAENGQ